MWPFLLGMQGMGPRLISPVVGIPFWFISDWGQETGHAVDLVGDPLDTGFCVNYQPFPRETHGMPFPFGMNVEPD